MDSFELNKIMGAVLGTCLIAGAFLVLGAELLQPRGLVPEEQRVADTLERCWAVSGGVPRTGS